MDPFKESVLDDRVKRTMENLEKNRMKAFYVKDAAECATLVKELLKPDEIIAAGGSMTLHETGVMDLLKSGEYQFLDRYAPGLTPDEVKEVYRKSFFADTYLCSSNAITENGELYNVDGNGNRVAVLCYGPDRVIVVVGINKIVRNLDEAALRVKEIAAPANCRRLSCQTHCNEKGQCVSLSKEQVEMADGCNSDARICCSYVVTAKQRVPNRIHVVLVGQQLGY